MTQVTENPMQFKVDSNEVSTVVEMPEAVVKKPMSNVSVDVVTSDDGSTQVVMSH